MEDCGLALGQAFLKALGDKRGVRRYGAGFDPRNPFTGEAHVPMDECLARCVIDFSGRPYLVWRGMDELAQRRISVGDQTQDMSSAFRFGLAREFFQGFANEAKCNLHLELLYGGEPHHVVEVLFKSFAKAFAGGKFRVKKWGRLKIINELEARGLTKNCIRSGMSEIDETDYRATLSALLSKKAELIADNDLLKKKDRLAKFAIQKGYEPELVWKHVKQLVGD